MGVGQQSPRFEQVQHPPREVVCGLHESDGRRLERIVRPPPIHAPLAGGDLYALLPIGQTRGGANLAHVFVSAVQIRRERGLRFLVPHRLGEEIRRHGEGVVDDILRYTMAGHDEETHVRRGSPQSLRDVGCGTADIDDGDGAIVDGGSRSESTRPE